MNVVHDVFDPMVFPTKGTWWICLAEICMYIYIYIHSLLYSLRTYQSWLVLCRILNVDGYIMVLQRRLPQSAIIEQSLVGHPSLAIE